MFAGLQPALPRYIGPRLFAAACAAMDIGDESGDGVAMQIKLPRFGGVRSFDLKTGGLVDVQHAGLAKVCPAQVFETIHQLGGVAKVCFDPNNRWKATFQHPSLCTSHALCGHRPPYNES